MNVTVYMIAGSSIHNQRIERLWRDMPYSAVKLLFYYLEEHGILNPNDDIDIYALHYVCITRVNRSLSAFKEGWNNYGLRTEHGQTPHQLSVAGTLHLHQSGQIALETVHDGYGIDEETSIYNNYTIGDSDTNTVTTPQGRFALTAEHLEQLKTQVDPLQESENHGVDL